MRYPATSAQWSFFSGGSDAIPYKILRTDKILSVSRSSVVQQVFAWDPGRLVGTVMLSERYEKI